MTVQASDVNDRVRQRQQVINYWSQRIEQNKARWSQDVRNSFAQSLLAIDQQLSNSMEELKRNPHDPFYEQTLDDAMDEKLQLLKDFSDL